MVPASTLRYGSTLIEDTFRPWVFRSRPVEEAVDAPNQFWITSQGSVTATYNALRVLVLPIESEQTAAVFTTHLPHAADHTSGNKYVFHGCDG